MNTIKNTRIATCCNWIFFLFAFFALFTGISKQASAQTAIANPGGITPTLAFTDTRAIGFPNGQTYTYTYASWPACTGWGLPTVIPVINGNVSGACGTYSNVTFNAAPASPFNIGATTNLAGGVAVYTGTTTYQFWTGSGWNTTAGNTNVRLIVTVTNGTNPMALQQQGAFIICPIPDPSATIVVNVKLQAYGPTPAVYATTGTGTTIAPPAGNTYTCTSYANTWAGAIQLFNCISTNGQNICTQFPGTTNSWVFYSGVVPAAPAAPTGATTICTGGSATLTRTGTPTAGTTWYWQTSTGGTDVTNSGATLAVTPASTTTYYLRPRVGTCWGTASAGVIVTVVADLAATTPTITNATVCAGNGSTVLSSNGSGGTGAFTFTWQYNNGGTWGTVANGTPAGATYTVAGTSPNSTLTVANITNPGTYQYRLRVTQAASGCAVNSAATTLTVVADPTAPTLNVATPASGTSVCVGATVSATFNVSSNGTGTCTNEYQSTVNNGTTWLAYTPGNPLTAGTAGTNWVRIQSRRVCSGNGCDGAGETFATVAQWSVVADPTFTTQPVAGTICTGGTRTLTAAVNPVTGPVYTYDWQESNDNGVGDPWVSAVGGSGANTLSYTTPALTGNLWHRLVVTSTTGGCTTPITSSSVLTTVVADPVATAPTISNATVCVGALASPYSVLSSTASGGTGAYTFQWQYNNGGTWVTASNGTPTGAVYTVAGTSPTSTLTITTAPTTPGSYEYRLRVTQVASGCEGFSSGTTITVVADPTAPTLNVATPASGTSVCVGATVSATFNVSSNGTGTCTNEYQSTVNNGTTWLAYTPGNPLTAGTAGTNWVRIQSRRVCSGSGCDGAGETFATVAQWTVVADPTFTLQPVAGTICTGGTRTLTATVSPVTGPVYTYDWQESNDNGVGDPWVSAVGGSGANTLSYTTPALTGNLWHRLVVTSTTGGCTTPITSSSVLTTVVADPVAPNPSITNASVCRGGSTVVSSTGSGGSGTILYQWQYNNGGTWVTTSNGTPVGFTYTNPITASMTIATNNAITTPTGTFQFRVRVYTATSGCETFSNPVDFTVASDPTAPTLNVATPASGTSICIGDQVSATFNLSSNGTGVCTDNYQYTLTGAAPFSPYTPGTSLTATSAGTNRIIIQTSRTCGGVSCDGTGETFATVAQWTVLSNITGTTFTYTNPTSCTTSNGTVTISGATGGSGTYQYSINGGASWQASGSFTGIADGFNGTVMVRNSTDPRCPVTVGSFTMQEPHEPISAATTSINPTDLCANNIATLTASNMAPGNGGNGGSGAVGPPAQPALPTQGAFTYNGTTQYSACNTTSVGLPTGSSITVEAWINPTGTYAQPWYNGLVTWGARSGTGTSMGVCLTNAGRPNLATWGWDLNPTSGPSVVANTWSHIAVTLNGATVTTYINGMQAYQANLAGTPNVQALAGQWLTIGCLDAPGRYFSGSIDNVRIWAAVRTQAEIQSDMYKDIPNTGTVSAATLRANYLFNLASLLNNGPGAGPTLNVNTGTPTYPAAYSYLWSGANNPGDNPPATIYEQVTVGPLQGISNYQVIATRNPANGCSGTLSTLGTALINDFTSTPFTSSYVTSGSAQGVTIPGTLTSGTLMGRPNGVTYSYTYAQNLTTGAGVCTNWGVPTTIANVVGVGSANTSLTYFSGSPTDLNNGIVAFRGTIAVPANYFWAAGFGSSPGFNWNVQLVFTVRNGSGGVIRGDFVSSGDIMFRINSNFTIKAELQAIPPAGRAYMGGSGQGGTSCATIAAAAGGTTYYSILDVYDCLAKVITTPQLYSSFNFDKFPKFVLASPISTTTPISVCHGGYPLSAFKLEGNTGSIPLGTTNCGGLSHTWLNSAGTTVSTLQTTNAITADATTAPASPGTIYNYVVSNGVSNICYGSAQATVSRNIAVVNGSIWSNGAVGTTYYGTVVPTVLDPTQQVTGNDSWYDNRNWDHCVPDAATNSYILYNATNPANINSNVAGYWGANAKTKFLKIDVPNGAKLMINANGTTKLNVTD